MPSTPPSQTFPAVPSSSLLPALHRAVTLHERARARSYEGRACDPERGAQRLRRWAQQHPFGSGRLFRTRLAAAGLDESRFIQLLGEPDEGTRERPAIDPAWVRQIEAACAADLGAGALPLGDSVRVRPEHGFLTAARPLLQCAYDRLRAGVAAIAARHAWPALESPRLAGRLGEEMTHAAIELLSRTMTLELHVARLEGRLEGESAERRFGSFIDGFRTAAARATLFREYPVLGRLLISTLDRHVETRLEFVERLAADREELRTRLGGPGADDEITGIHTIGDPHRGGRGVLLVRFGSGFVLVYKPKPLSVDAHFQDLLQWLNDRGWTPPFRPCRLLDRGDYGWMEFLRPEPCRGKDGVARFYRRIGGSLALLHTLGATDLHFENLVAVGEQPQFVDLETLFHPALLGPSPDTGTRRAYREISESVLSVGLLPERAALDGTGEDVDLSGLGARGDQHSPVETPGWVASGTDGMRLERRRMLMPIGEHCPTLDEPNRHVDFTAYASDIVEGFEAMYRLLLAQRDALRAPGGPLLAFRDDRTRVVLRPTYSYYTLLREGGHPDLLRDALDRDRHFDRLWAGVSGYPDLERVVVHEHEDLWWGDIPLFTTRPSSQDLWARGGTRIPDYLRESGWEMVERRLRRMGEGDLERQRWLVQAALATALPAGGGANVSTLRPTPRPLRGATAIEVATAAGDRLVDLALTEDGHASWLGEMPTSGGGVAIRPLGPDLYAGLSGVTLFLAWLGRLTGEPRYGACAQAALRSLRAQAAGGAGTAGIGGFTGWGSVVYALAHLAVLLDEPALAHEAEALAERLAPAIDADDQLDVLGGAAGFVLALVSLHRVTGSTRAIALARRCGDRLLATAQPAGPGVGWIVPGTGDQPLAGLSHGTAGIALSLLALSDLTGDRRYRETARAAIAYERTLFDSSRGSWRDLRSTSGGGSAFVNAWCHGAPGIGLARVSGVTSLDDDEIRSEIEIAVTTTLREGFAMSQSLCHGALGNLELPLMAARAFGRTDWQSAVEAGEREILRRLTGIGPIYGSLAGLETPGLMNGLAGVGYGLLRLAYPDRVPSVLALEAPRHDPLS